MAVGSPDSVSRAERRRRREVNGLLMLDKPGGMTSNSAMLEVRRLFQAQKCGHTGTLDPMASGALPICLGHTTKLSGLLLDAPKQYRAVVRLGERRDTGDADGTLVEQRPVSIWDQAALEAAAGRFIGEIQQTPPMYSAVKVDGKRLYALAREGVEVPRAPRQVRIESLVVERLDDRHFVMTVSCSKGTYIRTLAEDIAAAFGQLAYLTELRRLSVGGHLPDTLVTLGEITELAWNGYEALDALLWPSITLLPEMRQLQVNAEQCAAFHLGRTAPAENAAPGEVALIGESGLLMGLGTVLANGRIQPNRWFGGIR